MHRELQQARSKRHGLIIFAAIMLLPIGLLNLIDGIAAIANSHVLVASAHCVSGLPTPAGRLS